MNSVQKAIDLIGWPAKLAKQLKAAGHSCSPQQVHAWTLDKENQQYRPVPIVMALAIEKMVDGKVTAKELCPDFDWQALQGEAKHD